SEPQQLGGARRRAEDLGGLGGRPLAGRCLGGGGSGRGQERSSGGEGDDAGAASGGAHVPPLVVVRGVGSTSGCGPPCALGQDRSMRRIPTALVLAGALVLGACSDDGDTDTSTATTEATTEA